MSGGQGFTASAGTAVGAITIALAGIAVAVSAGSVTPNNEGIVPLTGSSVSVQQQTISPSWSQALTGSASTSGIGTLAVNLRPTDISVPAITSFQGNVSASGSDVNAHLSGVESTFEAGFVGGGFQFLSGQSFAAALGTAVPNIELPISGVSCYFGTGFMVPEQQAVDSFIESFSGTAVANSTVPLTGSASTFSQGTVTVTGDAFIPLTGEAVTASAGTMIPGEAYPISGVSITSQQQSMGAPGGATLSGAQVSVIAGDVFTDNDRTYALTGLEITSARGDAVTSYLAFVTGQSLTASAQEFGPRNAALTGEQIISYQGAMEPPRITSTEAGGKKKRGDRYIARFKGEDYSFSNIEDLEEFVEQAQQQERNKPKKIRKPVKIRLTQEFNEKAEDSFSVRLPTLTSHKAIEHIKLLENRLKEEYDEEEAIWLSLIS